MAGSAGLVAERGRERKTAGFQRKRLASSVFGFIHKLATVKIERVYFPLLRM